MSAIIAQKPIDTWDALLGADCCCAKVRTIEEAIADPHFLSTGTFDRQVDTREGGTMKSASVPLDPVLSRPSASSPAPRLGADNHLLTAKPEGGTG